MPISEGSFEVKVSTTFHSIEEGLMEMKKKLDKSRKIRISNIPMAVLDHFLPDLKGKDVMIIIPHGAKPTPAMMNMGNIAVMKAKVYKDYKGKQANLGTVYFSDRVFTLTWTRDELIEVEAMDHLKCVKCMGGTFQTGWRYAEKI